MEDRNLVLTLQESVLREMQLANNYATRKTIHMRVLEKIAALLGISWIDIQELTKLTFVHPQCLKFLEELWNFETTDDEAHILEKILSRDYAKTNDIIKMIGILTKYVKDYNKIYQLFAVDGVLGSDLKKYTENLKFSFYGNEQLNNLEIHYRAVRNLYNNIPLSKNSFEIVYLTLYNLFEKYGVEMSRKPMTLEIDTKEFEKDYLESIGVEKFNKDFIQLLLKHRK
ncbi:uncharacterized protein TNIN_179281 [Trichonephila inaurata madagascariensis]|uniref:Uncharacterized protein n=1 Tax=Trichonephila inaurata madagascariensis TaxID=2747483 RepID=A0A8X6YA53_9ARAC|nr:uncharacterized protein TNIN_179281 [Trichonephila inaurata madagascariensis]